VLFGKEKKKRSKKVEEEEDLESKEVMSSRGSDKPFIHFCMCKLTTTTQIRFSSP
jgi:hypothetical protein